MLMRTDPFRELDRLSQQFSVSDGTPARPALMPMDAYREGDQFVVLLDIPGVDPEAVDLSIERNVLTIRAERKPSAADGTDYQVAERRHGVFSRQLFLSDTLDSEHIEARYDAGVLCLRIPVAEQAKPHRIEITAGSAAQPVGALSS